jgi:hypothetical protein
MLALLLAALPARADSIIAPFVDSQTSAVVHIDFSQLDIDQLDAWIQKSIAQIPDPAERAKQQENSQKNIAHAKEWIAKFKAAGGKDVYIVVSLAGIMQGAPGGMIFPLNGADPDQLAKVLSPAPPPTDPNNPNPPPTPPHMQTAVVGNVLVMPLGGGLDKLKTPSTEPRQDLIDALAAGGDSTLHIVFNPASLKDNPIFAGMIMSRMPNASQQPPFSDPHWNGVTWMSISLSAPPKEAGNCTIQCKDSDSATALADYINQSLQAAKTDPTKRGNMDADDFAKLIDAVKPTVTGTQVVIAIDQNTCENVIGPIITKQMNRAQAAPPPGGPDNGAMPQGPSAPGPDNSNGNNNGM